jgi:ATP-binding cassette subfamily B protein
MVAKYYKKDISLQYLRDKTQIGHGGVNLLGISEAAESIGFRTKAVKISYQLLVRDAHLPAILHWRQNHFVVLYKASRSRLYVADPAKGLITYSPEEFRRGWIAGDQHQSGQGIALLLDPSPKFFDNELDTITEKSGLRLNNFFHYLFPYKKLLFQLFIGLLLSSLLQLFVPFLTQSIVDTGVNTENIQFVFIILLAQVALFAGRTAVEFVRSWILLHINTRLSLHILTDFLIKLMKLPLAFFESKHTGDILQRMNDHKRIEQFLTGSSLSILFSFVTLLVFSFTLSVFNIRIFLVFITASTIYSLWVALFFKKKKQLDYKRFGISAQVQSTSIQMVQGMQEIKLNGVEKSIRWKWEQLQVLLFKLSVKSLSLSQWQSSGAFLINESKNIFITFLSAKAVIDGQMSLGTMLAVQYMVGQLNSPIEQMIGFLQNWQNAKISIERLNEIHKLEDEEPPERAFLTQLPARYARQLTGGKDDGYRSYFMGEDDDEILLMDKMPELFDQSNDHPSSSSHPNNGNAITFRDVSFTYPGAGNEPVLRNVTLSFPEGKTTAIVGISGSGKTSLLKLLLKFYEPQKGEIRYNETLFSNISPKFWRSQCSIVMQESFIFSESLARNIALGNERIDIDRLNLAVEIANIREFVESLPLGFSTVIGPEGTGISMGQKQRILIARAVYRNPKFIFFDEATNSLDANNESVIIHNLNTFFKGRTVIIVAHRLSTVKNADNIIVLNKGQVIEQGTHNDLVKLKGPYFTLVKNQLELGQ